jgi:hypothetical protein
MWNPRGMNPNMRIFGLSRWFRLIMKDTMVNTNRVSTVLNVDRKNSVLASLGLFAPILAHAHLITYSRINAGIPIAASIRTRSRCFRMFIPMKNAGSRPEMPFIPSITGICPNVMVMADPVIKADTAGKEMRSTSQPRRSRPSAVMMPPAIIAIVPAKTSRASAGCSLCKSARIAPVTIEATATGPMLMSLEEPKIQYVRAPTNEV